MKSRWEIFEFDINVKALEILAELGSLLDEKNFALAREINKIAQRDLHFVILPRHVEQAVAKLGLSERVKLEETRFANEFGVPKSAVDLQAVKDKKELAETSVA